MTNKTTATIVTTQEGDDVNNEISQQIMRAYGCDRIVVLPRPDADIEPGQLYITNRGSDFERSVSGRTFSFSVRVVTFKVAIEMVKIDKESGAQ